MSWRGREEMVGFERGVLWAEELLKGSGWGRRRSNLSVRWHNVV